MIVESHESTEIFSFLENFVAHGDDTPVRGRRIMDRHLQNMWKLGYAEGATIAIWAMLNRMCKPGHDPYTPEVIQSTVVMPLLLSGDISAAEQKVERMIGATWNAA